MTMTKEEIIVMARESGMELYGFGKDRERFVHHLTDFAKLVAKHEREACAKEAETTFYSVQAAENIRARGQE